MISEHSYNKVCGGGMNLLKQEKVTESAHFYKWLVLILATGVQASATLVTYGVGPLSFFWKKLYNLSDMQMGLLLTAVNIGPLFCMLVAGRLLDQYNEKLLMGMGSILLGGSLLLVHLADGFMGLFIVLCFVGVFYSTAQPGGSKVILKWFPKENRGFAMGIRQAGIPIGGAIAGGIIPFLSVKFSLSLAIYVLSSICIIGGILFFLFYKEPFHSSSERVCNKKSISFLQQLKMIASNKKLYPVLFTGICMISLQLIVVGHFMKFLTATTFISPILAGKIFSIMLFCGMIGRVALATISDRLYGGNRTKPLMISVFVACFCVIAILNIKIMSIGYICMVSGVLGFFSLGWFSLFIVEVTENANENEVSFTVSFALTLNQVAILLAPPIFGFVVDKCGYTAAWIGIALCILASGISLLIHLKKEHK